MSSQDTPEACRVALFLEEKDIHFLKATTFVQSDEGGLDGHVGIRNFFGRAERFRLACEWGSRKSTEYALEFCKPRIKGLPILVSPGKSYPDPVQLLSQGTVQSCFHELVTC